MVLTQKVRDCHPAYIPRTSIIEPVEAMWPRAQKPESHVTQRVEAGSGIRRFDRLLDEVGDDLRVAEHRDGSV
jgi:hypothetical protein